MKFLNVIKILLIIVLISYLGWLINSHKADDLPMKTIESNMMANESIAALSKGSDKTLAKYFSLDSSDLDGYFYRKSTDTMDVDEILIVKVKDPSQIGNIEAAINGRLKSQKKNFEGYGVEQTALLKNNVLESKGKYIFFAVSKNAEAWKELFYDGI